MKKCLAILLSVLMLLSSLACGIVLTATADDVSTLPSDLFIDFTTKAGYDAFVASSATNPNDGFFNVTHSYDTDSVKMVLPASNAAEMRLGCHGGYNVASTEYPVLAMKVKIPASSVYDHSAQWGKGPYLWTFNAGPASKDYSADPYKGNNYDLTTSDWQLVVLDMSDKAGAEVAWTRIQLRLNMLGKANTTPTMYMKWVGYFKSEAEAQTFFAGYTGPTVDDGDGGNTGNGDDVSGLKSDLFMDFTTKAKYDAFLESVEGKANDGFFNMTHSYDTDGVKMVLDAAKNTCEVRLGCHGGYTVSSTEYPILAMKVKIPASSVYDHSAQWGKGPYFKACHTGGGYINFDTGNKYNLNTSDWQLVVLDLSSQAGDTVNWTRLQLNLNMLAKANTSPTIYMQWAGYFKSEAEAQTFYNGYPGNTGGGNDDNVSNLHSDLFLDLTTKAKYDEFVAASATNTNDGFFEMTHSYDTDGVKMVLSAPRTGYSGNGSQVRLGCHGGYSVSSTEYPILAMKVKIPSSSVYDHSNQWGKGPYFWGNYYGGTWFYTHESGNKYNLANSNWQLVVVDMSSAAGDTVNWTRIQLGLNMLGKANTAPTIHLQWAGYFKNATDAQTYFDSTANITGGGSGDTGDDDAEVEISPFFYSYETQEDFNANVGQALPDQNNPGENTVKTSRADVTYVHKTFSYAFGANAGGNTVLSYDPELKAMKLVAKEDYDPDTVFENKEDEYNYNPGSMDSRWQIGKVNFLPDSDEPGNMLRYPYFAVKVKLADENYTYTSTDTLIAKNGIGSGYGALSSSDGYKKTTDWQLLILKVDAPNTDWKGVMLSVISNRTPVKAGQELAWIQWAGAFKSKEDAIRFNGGNVAEDEEEEAGNWFIDFSTKDAYDDAVATNVVAGNNGAVISFSEETGAMKVLAGIGTDGKTMCPKVEFRAGQTRKAAVEDYPIFAMKIKLGDPMNSRLWSCFSYATAGYTGHVPASTVPFYKNTDEWQLVTINFGVDAKIKGQTGDWFQFLIYVDELYRSHNMPYYIQSVGMFKDVKAAQTYYGFDDEGEAEVIPKDWFIDFSTKDAYDDAVATHVVAGNNGAVISFSEETGAMKVLAGIGTDGKTMCPKVEFRAGQTRKAAVEDYPIFAMKIKLGDPMNSRLWSCFSYATAGYTGHVPASTVPFYENTDEWQLVTINFGADAKVKGQTGDWSQFLIYVDELYRSHNMPYYIQWVGMFKDVEAAQKYYGVNTEGGNGDDSLDGSEDTIAPPTKVFWDLSSKKVIKNQVEVAGDTSVSFDADMDAMKVLATDATGDGAAGTNPGRITLGNRVPLEDGLSTEEYPYIAMRVRLNNANLQGGKLYVRSTGTVENYFDGMLTEANLQVAVLDYDPTTDWQTIIVNYKDNATASFFFTGDWMSMMLNMFNTVALEGDAVWMRWAGAFKSETDIADYVAATKHQEKTIDVGTSGGEFPDLGEDPDLDGSDDNTDGDVNTDTPDDSTSPDTGDIYGFVWAMLIAVLAAATLSVLYARKRMRQ